MNCAFKTMFVNTDKLCNYGTLINCAITDIFMNTDKLCSIIAQFISAVMDVFTNTNKLCNYGYIYEHCAAFVILMTYGSSIASKIFTTLGML